MLKVKHSKIPGAGKGLFTTKPIKKDEVIVEYKGDKLTWRQVQKRYPKAVDEARYLFWIKSNHWVDAEFTKNALARYANDASGSKPRGKFRNNAEYQIIKDKPYIVATKNISAGEEILVDYAGDYWKNLKK